jgi:hypothetical protein
MEEERDDEEDEEKDANKIGSFTIDLKYMEVEFQCPIPSRSEKPEGLSSRVTRVVKTEYHVISNPVLTSCCKTSVCLKCVVLQVLNNHKIRQSKQPECCFCGHPISLDSKHEGTDVARLVSNRPLKRLIESQIAKNYS